MVRISISLFCLFLYAAPAIAQEGQRITLEEAIDIALENNVQIKRSLHNIERQESNVLSSRMNFLPNLNAQISTGRTIGRQFDQIEGVVDNFTADRLQPSISSSVTIFNGWQNINNLRASRSSLSAAEDDHERNRETIMFNTAAQFLEIILDEELLKIARDNLETSRVQLEQVEAQVEVGMRPIVDLYNQEATVAETQLLVIQRENALNLSKVRLVGTLQIDPFVEYDFILPDVGNQEFVSQHYELSDLVDRAMASRRDIRAAEQDIQAQRYSLSVARGGYYPSISLSGNFSSNYSSVQAIDFNDQLFDANINRGLSLNIQIPIFNRLQTRTNIQQNEINYRNALLDMESLRVEVFQEIRQAYDDYATVIQQLETTEILERAAEKAFETEQERYNVGSSTLIELNDANNRFVSAASERVQAQYRFIFQERILQYYLGEISSSTLTDIN